MLARLAAAREERLERLRRELDHAVAFDPARPTALEVLPFGLNMQSFSQGSVCTMTSAIPGCSRRIRSSTWLACACASASGVAPSRPSVRTQRARRGLVGSAARAAAGRSRCERTTARSRRASRSIGRALRRLGQRLEVRLHVRRFRHRGARSRARRAPPAVRLLERQVARQLEVERDLSVRPDREHGHVVHLAHTGNRSAAACARSRTSCSSSAARRGRRRRSSASASLDGILDGVRRRVTLPDRRPAGRRSRRRRSGGRAAWRMPQPAQLDAGSTPSIAVAGRSSAASGTRPSARRRCARISRTAAAITSTATKSAATESPSGCRRARDARPTRTAVEPARSLPKCSAFDCSAALSYRRAARSETTVRLASTTITTSTTRTRTSDRRARARSGEARGPPRPRRRG